MPGDDRSTVPQGEPERLTNRDRVPPKRKATARVKKAAAPQLLAAAAEPAPLQSTGPQLYGSGSPLTRADLANGRGLLYEWEFFVDALFEQLQDAGAGPQVFVYSQVAPASVWNIAHPLDTKPSIVVVDGTGQELWAEVHYPDDENVVVIHGQPHSGTVYLRA